ncbi:LysR family transcriptional regulator [Sphingomonas sp. SFZ2018-12]|uniref:LysR family transcriptional regulator n=1 Tax=Sphingomonas sp. SFZ2018-12 TaxID=2683197 RepID=UPI00082C623D|nr:LysR family transcriptional regulator [Sphingomonas sp. SFZ2018-12]MCH4893352.1 LysR family transcriptional regulator [Sphingomonas sp. SFZ2018-12]
MDDLDIADLAAFALVSEQRSFRGAAALRGVSASTMSAAVRRLEARLGVRLLTRTTRSVAPTEAGAELLAGLKPALAEVARVIDGVNRHRDTPRGLLRLNVPGVVADLILPSLLTRFLARYPDIRVEVIADDNFVDVLGSGFDAGVRYDERLEQDMIAVPIGPRTDRYMVAGSPDYLARHGVPLHPSDLVRHQAVRYRFASGRLSEWEFERDGQLLKVEPVTRFVGSRTPLLVAAAEAGLGLIGTFQGYLQPSVDAGRLVPVLEDWSTPFPGPFLYFAERRLMPTPLRAFVDFLRREAAGA